MNRYAGFKVLIVDDNEKNLFTLRSLIEKHMDVEILEATSGQAALDMALAQPDIDLIILDIQMPEMDGFQTATMLKVRKKTRDIPIIFLTAAFKAHEFQQKGYKVGGADYLLKPIDKEKLRNSVAKSDAPASPRLKIVPWAPDEELNQALIVPSAKPPSVETWAFMST